MTFARALAEFTAIGFTAAAGLLFAVGVLIGWALDTRPRT